MKQAGRVAVVAYRIYSSMYNCWRYYCSSGGSLDHQPRLYLIHFALIRYIIIPSLHYARTLTLRLILYFIQDCPTPRYRLC